MSDPNFDPRDEKESRPQVSFALDISADSLRHRFEQLDKAIKLQDVKCHDVMVFDGGRGAIRFEWETPATVVDATALWLKGLPFVQRIWRHYGGPALAPDGGNESDPHVGA